MPPNEQDPDHGRYVYLGIAVGIFILLFGALWSPTQGFRITLVSMGVGIILGALGEKAELGGEGWKIAGGGAAGLIVAMFIVRIQPAATFGSIRGDIDERTQIVMYDQHELLGAVRSNPPEFRFAIESSALSQEFLELVLDQEMLPDGRGGLRTCPVRARDHVNHKLNGGYAIKWRYQADSGELMDEGGEVVARCTRGPGFGARSDDASNDHASFRVFGATIAFAEAAPCSADAVERSLKDLSSGALRLQVGARDYLASCGSRAAPAVFASMADPGSGVSLQDSLWALLAILRRSDSSPEDVWAPATNGDIERLVDAIGTSDPSKGDAGELAVASVMELGDPRAAGPLLAKLQAETDPQLARRWLRALEGVAAVLPPAELADIKAALVAEKPRLDDDVLSARIDAFGEERFFIVTDSFRRENDARSRADELRRSYDEGGKVNVRQLTTGKQYYAVTIGPYDKSSVISARRAALRDGLVSRDAWLSTGARFEP